MEKHIRRVALLHGLLSCLNLLGAALLIWALGRADVATEVGPLLTPLRVFAWGSGALGAFGLFTARALARGEGWARLVTIVLGALWLPSPLVGTALGLYTLWTLLSEAGAKAYVDLTRVKLYDQAPGFGGATARPTGMSQGACCGLFVLWVLISGLALAPLALVPDLRGRLERGLPGAPAPATETPATDRASPAATDGAPPPPSRARRARPVEGMHGVYTWTDDAGKVHVTQDYWSIPAQYR